MQRLRESRETNDPGAAPHGPQEHCAAGRARPYPARRLGGTALFLALAAVLTLLWLGLLVWVADGVVDWLAGRTS